ncbi:MAG TPA: hypothetical protein ACFYD2_05960 [Candidatus Avalokitesvara rifleensis]|uniref:hypothetical protein n=1 Tax=Candidatus Avalokitesvara rifleensis TaxID=3367620 RepID=UPI002713AAAB|nr:hypothetical protein [Candidatus Brocadiales bacterium]
MVSQAKVLIATAFTFLVLCAPVQGMLINLTPGQIEEAVEYGKAGKDTKMADFSKEWTVSLGEKVGWATLYSEFHNLAYKARKAAVEKRELFPHEVKKALERRDVLTFSVTVMTDSLYYNYHRPSTLRIGDRVLPAAYEFQPKMCEDSDYFPESPYYVAACVYQFPIQGIEPNSKIILTVLKPEGDEINFDFDLSKLR